MFVIGQIAFIFVGLFASWLFGVGEWWPIFGIVAAGLGGYACGCCDDECTVFSDRFTRADSTDLGSDYTESAGAAAIVSNALDMTASSTVVDLNTTHSSEQTVVTVDVKASTSGDQFRIYLGTTGTYVQWQVGTGGHLKLNDGASDVTSRTENTTVDTLYRIRVCSYGDRVMAMLTSLSTGSLLETIYDSATVDDGSAALGTGTCSGTITVDNLELAIHYTEDGGCRRCNLLGCNDCPNQEVPYALEVETSGIANDAGCTCTACPALNAVYILDLYGTNAGPDYVGSAQACNWWQYKSGLSCGADGIYFNKGSDDVSSNRHSVFIQDRSVFPVEGIAGVQKNAASPGNLFSDCSTDWNDTLTDEMILTSSTCGGSECDDSNMEAVITALMA